MEIKGRWIRDAKEKWEEFNQKYPNSEVWLLKDLKKFGFKHNKGKLMFDFNTTYDDLLIKVS